MTLSQFSVIIIICALIPSLIGSNFLQKGHDLCVSIDKKLDEVKATEKIIQRKFITIDLEKINFLNGNLLKLLLQPINELLLSSYLTVEISEHATRQVNKQKALNHIKSLLCPKNFFSLSDTGLKVPYPIQEQIFMLLNLAQISQVFIENTDCESRGISATKEDENIINRFRNLVLQEGQVQLINILVHEFPELEALPRRLFDFPCSNYGELCLLISEAIVRLRTKKEIKEKLPWHPFFTQKRLLAVLSHYDVALGVLSVMKTNMATLSHSKYRLYLFLLKNSYKELMVEFLSRKVHILEKDPNTWKGFLDQFICWLIKEKNCTVKKVLKWSLDVNVDIVEEEVEIKTWKDVIKLYIESRKRDNRPLYDPIRTFEQLKTVDVLSAHKLPGMDNPVIIQTICKIIDLVKDEFQYESGTSHDLLVNIITGAEKALKTAIEQWPIHLPIFLETVFPTFPPDFQYVIPFLKALSSQNENQIIDELAVVDNFLGLLRHKGVQSRFILKMVHNMELVVNVYSEDLESISTAQDLFIWINKGEKAQKILKRVKDSSLRKLLKKEPPLLFYFQERNDLVFIDLEAMGDALYQVIERAKSTCSDQKTIDRVLVNYKDKKTLMIDRWISMSQEISWPQLDTCEGLVGLLEFTLETTNWTN